MITKIDKYGRLILPKKLRMRLGITNRASLKVNEKGNAIVIEAIEEEQSIIEKDGILVFTGEIIDDTTDFIAKERSERANNLI